MKETRIIGVSREIAFNKAGEECPKFWGEYYETLIKPVVVDGKTPDEMQQAAFENHVGEFALCTCRIPNHNCDSCAAENFTPCNTRTFTYVIGGTYKGGSVPQGMKLYPLRNGRWLKVHFEGGMKAFQRQHQAFYGEWLPQHPEYRIAPDSPCMEWYQGTDIEASDYPCGVMLPLA